MNLPQCSDSARRRRRIVLSCAVIMLAIALLCLVVSPAHIIRYSNEGQDLTVDDLSLSSIRRLFDNVIDSAALTSSTAQVSVEWFEALTMQEPELESFDSHDTAGHSRRRRTIATASDVAAPAAPAEESLISFDLASLDTMMARFAKAKAALIHGLEQEYGADNFAAMFTTTTTTTEPPQVNNTTNNNNGTTILRGRFVYASPTPDGLSYDRLKRKLMQKLLMVKINAMTSETSTSEGSNNHHRNQPVSFIWATGGHSSAAGHGNLYNESYTAVMERTIRPLMAAVGIDFVGRNHAMGGTSSGPEVAACVDAIFGTDFDVLSWDFGMTDGANLAALLFYFYRAGRHANRPACLAMFCCSGRNGKRKTALEELERRGVTTLYMNENILGQASQAVPDTLGKSEEEIAAMPPLVRSFKCGNQMENGDPTCGKDKYNEDICPQRKFKAKWHPGWKNHALTGNMNALFLVELMADALDELKGMAAESTDEPSDVLANMQSIEAADYNVLREADLPVSFFAGMMDVNATDIDMNTLMKEPNVCHTGRLPAEIRHKGILTETTTQTGTKTYEQGMDKGEADTTPNDSEFMRLVMEDNSRQSCDVPLNMDYKDYFYVHEREGWKKLVVPNAAEQAEYGTSQPWRGYVAVCFAVCSWGKCPRGNLLGEHLEQGDGEMEVNGVAVTKFSSFQGCVFLKHADGHQWRANSDGRFEIRVRAIADRSYVRISSVVIW